MPPSSETSSIAAQPIWYAAYGSNLNRARFDCYLRGGQPVGGSRTYPGCRDTSPPRDQIPITTDGCVHFAGESSVWGGGIAFFDPLAPGRAIMLAYLLSVQQLEDVAAQEMHREPGAVRLDVDALVEAGVLEIGAGHYETPRVVAQQDGLPVVTISHGRRGEDVVSRRPAPAYLPTMVAGLRTGCGLTKSEVVSYLLE